MGVMKNYMKTFFLLIYLLYGFETKPKPNDYAKAGTVLFTSSVARAK
jgi:hypothetical protein